MDVIFEVQRGKTFSIEVGFFDTILEIKEKVHKYQGIPVSNQTLLFNGRLLQENDDVWKVEILQNSRIQIILSNDSDKTTAEELNNSPQTKTIHLNVKTPNSPKMQVLPLEMDVNDTVLKLKEKIHETETVSVPVNRLLLHATGTELHDNQVLKDCDMSDNSEIEVSFKPSPTSSSGGGSKKLKLTVKTGTKRIPVDVNACDNVGELRKELQKVHQKIQFQLPQDGYFFIYKQNVMDDDKSFRWHHVGPGDTIEIFNGSVSGGS
ncbi:hypothetical protein RJT34_23702 [Clitoria ternatea]|uniref:Ubiquitin-like domain-containing protein n=1 Tax=Clitoria ternatea TaxID=43366 RepID=A0AAN9FLL6_CLITE